MIADPLNSRYWVEGRFHESARNSCGTWSHTSIELDFISIEEDTVPSIYQDHFLRFNHFNCFIRDQEFGPVVISVKFEVVNIDTLYHILLRFIGGTIYKSFRSDFFINIPTLDEIIHAVEPRLNFTKLHHVFLPHAPHLINKYDLHSINTNHKFGILFQRAGQTTEEDIISNCSTTQEFQEFLSFLGDSVSLKYFTGFSGGLDTKNDLTGLTSIYTRFQDREIMFHVSTLLPYDRTDIQQIQRKRHIGNDIVAILFQEENAIFLPGTFKSHFLKAIFVIQPVKDINARTIYKLSLVMDEDCPTFNPSLPHPPVYLKNEHFRIFLLIKMINAEASAYKSQHFANLNCRARSQLLENLIQELDQSTHFKGDVRDVNSDNKSSIAVRRKINHFFKVNSKEELYNIRYNLTMNQLSQNRENCPEILTDEHFQTISPDTIERDKKIHLRYGKFSNSEYPSTVCPIELPLRSEPPSKFSSPMTMSNTYIDKKSFCGHSLHRNIFMSNKHCVSLDEKSFSNMVLDSLSPNYQVLRSKSIGTHVTLAAASFDGLLGSYSKLRNVRQNSAEKADLCLYGEIDYKPNQTCHNLLFDHVKSKSQIIVDKLPLDDDISENSSECLRLQNELYIRNSERKAMGKEILKLQRTIVQLQEINERLVYCITKQSQEITNLNIDMRLFAYLQKGLI